MVAPIVLRNDERADGEGERASDWVLLFLGFLEYVSSPTCGSFLHGILSINLDAPALTYELCSS